jgi:CheY-like chemotaxis protein
LNGIQLSADLMFASRVSGAARGLGVDVPSVGSSAALLSRLDADTRLVVLDLGTPGLDVAALAPAIREKSPSAAIVAYAPHVHEQRLSAARDAGCDEVLTRGQFNAAMEQLLAKYLSKGSG